MEERWVYIAPITADCQSLLGLTIKLTCIDFSQDPKENQFFPSMDFVSDAISLVDPGSPFLKRRDQRPARELTPHLNPYPPQSNVTADPEVGAVMCGFDSKTNYHKLARAHRFLRENEGCHFILTNDDSTFPSADGQLYPGEYGMACPINARTLAGGPRRAEALRRIPSASGSGAISAPLRFALPHKPPIIIGKPNKPFMDCITQQHHLDKSRTIMVGDRLDTDVSVPEEEAGQR